MILTELSPISSGVLPFYNFKNHLRMGTGFAEADLQDPLIEAYLRAAIATIENKLGIAVIRRAFAVNLTAWQGDQHSLPIRPVQGITSVTLMDRGGASSVVGSDAFTLMKDVFRPVIKSVGGCLPRIPTDGNVTVVVDAGFGVSWDDIPADLSQGILLLAAHFYENRIGASLENGVLPSAVMGLIEPYRAIRVSGGRT